MDDEPEVLMDDGDDHDDEAAFDDFDDVDWSNVDEVAAQQAEIEAIEDPAERKAAAIAWANALQENT